MEYRFRALKTRTIAEQTHISTPRQQRTPDLYIIIYIYTLDLIDSNAQTVKPLSRRYFFPMGRDGHRNDPRSPRENTPATEDDD